MISSHGSWSARPISSLEDRGAVKHHGASPNGLMPGVCCLQRIE